MDSGIVTTLVSGVVSSLVSGEANNLVTGVASSLVSGVVSSLVGGVVPVPACRLFCRLAACRFLLQLQGRVRHISNNNPGSTAHWTLLDSGILFHCPVCCAARLLPDCSQTAARLQPDCRLFHWNSQQSG